jgi:proteasome accessory factor A
MGVEQEYALNGTAPDGARYAVDSLADDLCNIARDTLPHLPDASSAGVYCDYGRLYVDRGHHPELATLECTDPWEAARLVLQGDRMMARLAEHLEKTLPRGAEVTLRKGVVQYVSPYSSWGNHENYLMHAHFTECMPQVNARRLHALFPDCTPFTECAPHIIPHLVSRVCMTGAGGFHPLARKLEFSVSPRSAHITMVASPESTRDRPIFHLKRESLAGAGWDRLHVITGEGLCSETGIVLQLGTTALVAAMVEGGLRPGDTLQLRDPIDALRAVAADPSCRVPLRLRKGPFRTAIGIQRFYLGLAEACLDRPFMPEWGGRLCELWRRTLESLESSPTGLDTVLDWRIKLALFKAHVAQYGYTWADFESWGRLVALRLLDIPPDEEWFSGRTTDVVDSKGIVGTSTEHINSYFKISRELLEIDSRFAELGAKGIFVGLDTAGVLAHRLSDEQSWIGGAPLLPARGRGRVRAEVVRRLFRDRHDAQCTWDRGWDLSANAALDLSDPLSNEERWRPLGALSSADGESSFDPQLFAALLGIGNSLSGAPLRRPRRSISRGIEPPLADISL